MKLNKIYEKNSKFLSNGVFVFTVNLYYNMDEWIYLADITYFNVWVKDIEKSVIHIKYDEYR